MGNIIVMGGSFNPPTVAHLKLMQAALDQLPKSGGAGNRGIFVPSSDAYVTRKMGKQADDGDKTVLPEKLRLEMLKTFEQHDPRITVDSRELERLKCAGTLWRRCKPFSRSVRKIRCTSYLAATR